MAYIFPEHSEESQKSQEQEPVSPTQQGVSYEQLLAEQEVPVEESVPSEDGMPVLIKEMPPSSEASLPPEAQGQANGGPLGCCLGTILGLFLAFALVTGLSILMASGGTFVTVPVTLLGACVGGFVGWRIGKRVYKEYEPPVVKRRTYAYPTQTTRTKAKRRGEMPKS